MNVDEFHQWQRGEPDLHELIDGEPVRLADEKQITRRIFRVLAVAAKAYGSKKAAREWLESEQAELGAKPIDLAAEGWEGVLRCLRFLAAAVPGSTDYAPSKAPFRIGPAQDLLAEAERNVGILRYRRTQATALKAALDILDSWQMRGSRLRRILGFPTQDALVAAAEAAHGLGEVNLEADVLTCIRAVIAIHAALTERHGGEREALVWLRMSHATAAFAGQAPEDLITDSGLPGLLLVLGFLEATKAADVGAGADRPTDNEA